MCVSTFDSKGPTHRFSDASGFIVSYWAVKSDGRQSN
jgi:hypothetical protein